MAYTDNWYGRGGVPAPPQAPPGGVGGMGGGGGYTPYYISRNDNLDTPEQIESARNQALSAQVKQLQATPRFKAPEYEAPSYEDLANDPAYQFRLQQGQKALERSAAAKGLLRSGGTLQDILGFGQNLASQEAQNFYNRAGQDWERQFQAAQAEFQPKFEAWQFNRLNSGGGGGGGGGGYGNIPPPPQAPPQFEY